MSIEVEQEDIEELKKWGIGLWKVAESCHFCRQPTRTWHRASNTPVCSSCAAVHDRSDIKRQDVEQRQAASVN